MTTPIQLGIRISVDGQTAVPDIERIGAAGTKMAGQMEQAGQAMEAAFNSGSAAVSKTVQAVASLSETEDQAAERIRGMVAASLQQASAMSDGGQAVDKMAAATQRAAGENINLAESLSRVTAQMYQARSSAPSAVSNVSSQESQAYVTSLQRQFDMLGKNAAEQAAYEVKLQGGTKALQAQAAAIVSNSQALREQIAAEERSGQAAENFLAKLREQTSVLGMSKTQLLEHKAAQLGVADEAAPMIAKLGSASGHMDGLNFATAGAKRELLVLAHEMSQGNFQRFGGSMMVLGEQTGAAGLLFSAAGLAAIALTAAVVGVAYAMIKGATNQKHMDDALIMTGNYAGATSDKLNDLAHQAVETGGSISEAKKVVTELAGSGKFTADQIGSITEATVAWEHATGQSTKSIIKEFETLAVQTSGSSARSTEAVSRAALKLDDTYHFLTESVYEHIRALEKEGDAKGASALATETFARVTKERAEQITQNLGTIPKVWNEIKEAAGAALDAVNQAGARATPASDVKKASFELQLFDEGVAATNKSAGRAPDAMSASMEESRLKIVRELTAAVTRLNEADAAANAQGKARIAESEAMHAAARVAEDDRKLQKKGLSEMQVQLDQYRDDIEKIKAVNPDSILVTPDAVAAHEAAIIKAHTAQVRGNDDRAKLLQDAILIEQTALEREKGVYDQRDKMLTLYHSKLGLSDADFYAGRAAARNEYIAAEAAAFAREASLIQNSRSANMTPLELAANKEKYDALLKQHLAFTDKMRAQRGDDAASEVADAKKQYDDVVKAIQSSGIAEIKRLDDAIAKQKEHNAEIGKSKEQIERAKQATIDLDTTQLQSDADFIRNAINKEGFDQKAAAAYTMRLNYLDDEIVKRKILSEQLAAGAVIEADAKAAKAASTAWDSTAKHVQQTMADAIANGGGNAWKKLKASIASQVLNVPLQFIGSSVASALIPGAAQAGGSTLLSAAGNVSSLYNTATGGGLSGMIGTAGSGIAAVGNAIGSSTMSAFGAGFADTGAASMMTASETFAQAGMAAEASAASLGSAFAAAVPWVGAAMAAYAVWNKFFEDGPESDTRLTFASNNAVGNISNNERGESWAAPYIGNGSTSSLGTFGVKSTFWMDPNQEVVQSFLKTVGQTDDALAAFMTTAEKASVSSYLTGQTYTAHTGAEGSNPNANGQLDAVFANRINNILEGLQPGLSSLEAGFTGTSQQLATEVASLLQYRAALKDSGQALFGTEVTLQQIAALKQPTEATSAALTRVANEFQATNQVAAMMGVDASKAFGAAGLASEGARAQLILLSGGLSTFTSQASDYAQNFLTDSERLAPAAKQLDASLATLGLSTIPQTKAQFKALIDQIVNSGALATEQGAKQFAGLMALESIFAQVHAEEASAARSAADIASERSDLQKQLDAATMTSTQLAEKARAAIDGNNLALYDQVQAALAAKNATDALASANGDYQKQIDQLLAARQGEAAVRALETKGMDASTVALYDRLHALQAEDKAAQSVLSALTAGISTINDARQGIAGQMFDAVLGGRDLAGKVDMLKATEAEMWKQVGTGVESTAVLEKIRSLAMTRIDLEGQLQDKTIADMQAQYSTRKDALSAELDAMQKMRDYAQQLRGFTDGLKLGDLSALNPTAKLAEAQSQYNAMLAKAQGGDATAMSGLQGAAQSYLQLDKQYYGSTADYASTFSSVIGALEQFSSRAPTDSQISDKTSQIEIITSTSAALSTTVRDTSSKQVEVLNRIDAALARAQSANEAQLVQAGAANQMLVDQLQKTNAKLAEIESRMARMEAA